MGKVCFVSGIDTGIGKTAVVGAMCRALQRSGRDWISVKMVQTGCDGYSEDLDAHREMAGAGRFPEDDVGLTAPQIFRFPSSPLLAASLEGRKVDLCRIASSVAECAKRHDAVLVEGAGGLCVPLTEDVLAVDFAQRQCWPLVLVASGRLGAINHTLLSLEVAAAHGMSVAGVIMNSYPETHGLLFDDALNATSRHLRRLGIGCPVEVMPDVAADDVPDFSGIFERLGW